MGCLSLGYERAESPLKISYRSGEGVSEKSASLFLEVLVQKGNEPKKSNNYYPFGAQMPGRSYNSNEYRYGFQGQEADDEVKGNRVMWNYKFRMYDARIARFHAVDPLAWKYPWNSPYAFSENKVIAHVELEGLESVYVFDTEENPNNKRVYEAEIFVVHDDGEVSGPIRGSSFPNNPNTHNTLKEGTHLFNNESGHKQGTVKGLNIVDENGSRENAPGTSPSGSNVTMEFVNAHSGVDPDDNNGLHNRGSAGCVTCHPDDAELFFGNFDFSGDNNATGQSSGSITIHRGDSDESKLDRELINFKLSEDFLRLSNPPAENDATNVSNSTPIIIF